MQISLDSGVTEKLRTLLEQEDDDAVFRIRETKVGSACKAKFVLRLSIDEREDEDEEAVVDTLPFVANEELVSQCGGAFAIALDESGMPLVTAPNKG